MTGHHPWFGTGELPPPARPGAEELRQTFVHAMRDVGFNGAQVATRPLAVPHASAAELYAASARLLALLRTALLAAGPGREERMAALAVDETLHPLFTDDRTEERHCACMARPDVVIGPGGPQFLEVNVGGAVGGAVHTHVLTRTWCRLYAEDRDGPDGGRLPFHSHSLFAERRRLFEAVCAELGAERGVALLGTVRDLPGVHGTRYFDLEVDHLRRHGFAAEFFEPEDLHHGHGADGRFRYPVGLRHFTVTEWRHHGIDLAPVRRALDAGCLFLAPQTAYLVSNKKVLGWISEGRPWMTGADREFVRRYLPWTRVTGDRAVVWRGGRSGLGELLLGRREQFVLKKAVGMCGDGVLLGPSTDPAVWADAVERAVREEDSVAQEYVEPGRCAAGLTDGTEAGTHTTTIAPLLGPYIVAGRPAGCLVRYFADGGSGIVSMYGHGALINVLVGV
ncbi:hypothetical protein LKL35_22520 [Streptomyces sp. ET3-23]|uniref:hypothetical protein n=1 Tax=Streptomyces sp. ET3-23 TaxID=2885643 RepID=UPI001D10AEDA|nr:hypothetical protein [Streptomyces sp. ET3-23]MCC2278172.1 hypothetical protein [Streptomyces sp. ET3-23]